MRNLAVISILAVSLSFANCKGSSSKQQNGGQEVQQQEVQSAQQGNDAQRQQGGRPQQGGQRQGGGQRMTVEERAQAQNERMENLLAGLTDAQKTRLRAVNLELAKRSAEATQGDNSARQQIEATREEKYKEILTETQMKQFLDDREQRRQQRGQGGQGGQRNN